MTFDFDLFVIGGGSGGVRAARIAAGEHGARVALAEESRMGGTCVIRGCVPKKLMIFASQAGLMAEEMRGYGWEGAQAGRFDWPVFRHKLDAELTRLELIYTANLEKSGVQIFPQRATIVDDHTDAELVDLLLADLRELTGLGARPVETRVHRWLDTAPQLVVGHQERLTAARAALQRDLPGVVVAGASHDGAGISGCVTSALQAVTTLTERPTR